MKIRVKNQNERYVTLDIKDCGKGEISIARTNRDGVKDFDIHLVRDGAAYFVILFNTKIKNADDAFIREIDALSLGEAIDFITNLTAAEALG